jgi:hypothetical protein
MGDDSRDRAAGNIYNKNEESSRIRRIEEEGPKKRVSTRSHSLHESRELENKKD